jgi:hypothetical protein
MSWRADRWHERQQEKDRRLNQAEAEREQRYRSEHAEEAVWTGEESIIPHSGRKKAKADR